MTNVDIFQNLNVVVEQGKNIFTQSIIGLANLSNRFLPNTPPSPPLPYLDTWPVYAISGAIVGSIILLSIDYLSALFFQRQNEITSRNRLEMGTAGGILGTFAGIMVFDKLHK